MLAMIIVSGLTCNPWVLMAFIRRLYISHLVLMDFMLFIFFLCFLFWLYMLCMNVNSIIWIIWSSDGIRGSDLF